jgi:hypothetical protein
VLRWGLIETELLLGGWLLVGLGWFGCLLVRFCWFGGSVPVVVLVLAEQLQGLGGLGENTDGFGAPYLDGVGVASLGEDLSDPVDSGFEPDRIAGGRPGNDQLQAVLGLAAQPHEPFSGSVGGLLFGTVRVSLNDRCR